MYSELEPAALRPLAQHFAGLTQTLLQARTVDDVLHRVAAAARSSIAGADMVSLTLRLQNGGYTTPVVTDPAAARLDELQYRTNRGPAIDATRTSGQGVAMSDDLSADPRWPEVGRAAAEVGVGAVLCTGILPDSDPPRFGALNIYSRRPLGLVDADQDIALLLATHAALALATTQARTAGQLREAQLREALDSRDVIGQAKGILMVRRGISAEEAFEVLRHRSQELNVKLAEVARSLATDGGDL
ncbi:MAG TPA: ANTAR domain-containing protein [Actinophytocola sp.]|uniref:ANTAR domain-containing protein n=1 Tax=Actinophytocola sp. TaxID=1872138 RepID=UPI002DBF7063|nr:ANTAR domain-containing protein [Actinophytocola sp.]HEU5474185.1 ANTAR domain-containing protein [Actinophytocola sp.]